MSDHIKKTLQIFLGFGVVLAVLFGVYFFTQFFNKGNDAVVSETASLIPERINCNTADCGEFPANIPLESKTLSQNYGLDYQDKTQFTKVFDSTKTVEENFLFYKKFIDQDGWIVLNSYQGAKVSSLYGKKDGYEMNVTISSRVSGVNKSQVSVSILKK